MNSRLKGARDCGVIKVKILKMASSSNISLPHDKCMKCRAKSFLLSSCDRVFGNCNHKFGLSCFKKENMTIASTISTNYKFNCPCCRTLFYENMQSIDEAILIGEAVTLSNHIAPYSQQVLLRFLQKWLLRFLNLIR